MMPPTPNIKVTAPHSVLRRIASDCFPHYAGASYILVPVMGGKVHLFKDSLLSRTRYQLYNLEHMKKVGTDTLGTSELNVVLNSLKPGYIIAELTWQKGRITGVRFHAGDKDLMYLLTGRRSSEQTDTIQ